jgi:hypothetical protein
VQNLVYSNVNARTSDFTQYSTVGNGFTLSAESGYLKMYSPGGSNGAMGTADGGSIYREIMLPRPIVSPNDFVKLTGKTKFLSAGEDNPDSNSSATIGLFSEALNGNYARVSLQTQYTKYGGEMTYKGVYTHVKSDNLYVGLYSLASLNVNQDFEFYLYRDRAVIRVKPTAGTTWMERVVFTGMFKGMSKAFIVLSVWSGGANSSNPAVTGYWDDLYLYTGASNTGMMKEDILVGTKRIERGFRRIGEGI